MDFKNTKKHLVTKKDSRGYNTREIDVYYNKDFPFFGIAKNFQKHRILKHRWALVHLPSESFIATTFFKKQDVEVFFDYLMQETDVNSILLCTPVYKQIMREILDSLDLAYIKFYQEVKMK
jgi:hypothetical protein